MAECSNCFGVINTEDQYCPACGQKIIAKLRIRDIYSNRIGNYLALDGKLYKSLFPLLFLPGRVAKRFIQGQRTKYIHPGTFYFFTSLLLFSILLLLFGSRIESLDMKGLKEGVSKELRKSEGAAVDTLPYSDSSTQQDTSTKDEQIQPQERNTLDIVFSEYTDSISGAGNTMSRFFVKKLKKFTEGFDGATVKNLIKNIPLSLLLMMPLFTLLVQLFHFRRSRLSHALVFSLYLFGASYLVMTIFAISYSIFDIRQNSDIFHITYLYPMIWMLGGLRTVYQQSWFASAIKTMAICFLYLILAVPISLVITLAITIIQA